MPVEVWRLSQDGAASGHEHGARLGEIDQSIVGSMSRALSASSRKLAMTDELDRSRSTAMLVGELPIRNQTVLGG